MTNCGNTDSVSQVVTVVGGAAGFYTISGKSPICAGSSDTLTATGGTSYTWSNGDTTSTIIVNPTSTTTYSVHIAAGCNKKDTTITIVVDSSPTIVAPSTDSICSGSSVVLNVSGATSYLWSPSNGLSCTTCSSVTASPTTSTTYVITGSNGNGCTSSKSINVVVSNSTTLGVIPDQSICSGTQVSLVANLTSGNNGTYLWLPGGYTQGSISVSPQVTTTYTLEFTNACGITSTNVTVFVNPAPTPNFSTDITLGCAPLCMQFRDMSTIPSGTISMWRWTFGNGDTSDIENPIYCYPDTGTFSPTLTATSIDGCSATLKNVGMITVFSKPIANFIYSPQPINFLEPTVQFTDQSKDAYGISYWIWNFGDGQNPDSQNNLRNPNHTYGDTGTYCAQLVVMNNKGCMDTTTNCLKVNPIYTLYIPTAFSPNGDGVNDIFAPKGAYIKSFEMYIFDRWGQELFYSNDINKGWNGTIRGGPISQEDSFVYTITTTDWSNQKHSYVGQFSMVK